MGFQTVPNLFRCMYHFLQRPWAQKRLLMHVLLVAMVCRCALTLVSLQRILHCIQAQPTQKTKANGPTQADIIRSVITISRRFAWSTCLVSGLTGQYLLARNGYAATLHIGVKKESKEKLAAHAWVTIDHDVVIGMVDDLATYVPLQGFDIPT